MAQEFLHEFRVDAPAEKDRGARVSEIVEANRRQPCALQGSLEGSVGQQVRAQEVPAAVGKNKAAILPEASESEPLSVLGSPVALEGPNGSVCELTRRVQDPRPESLR